jgi:hypothetical protein
MRSRRRPNRRRSSPHLQRDCCLRTPVRPHRRHPPGVGRHCTGEFGARAPVRRELRIERRCHSIDDNSRQRSSGYAPPAYCCNGCNSPDRNCGKADPPWRRDSCARCRRRRRNRSSRGPRGPSLSSVVCCFPAAGEVHSLLTRSS